jgi:hypothetical protein
VRKIRRPEKGISTATEPKSAREKSQLERAVDDAELLLNYAAQQGVKVEKDTLEVIAGARELFEQGKLTGTLKADFYNNFGVLSRVASPVTVDSLKSCAVEKEFPSWLSNWFAEGKAPKWLPKWMVSRYKDTDAKRALRFYRTMGLWGLIFLVALQGYWVVGSYLMESIPIVSEDPKKREEGISQEAQWIVVREQKENKQNKSEPAVYSTSGGTPRPTPTSEMRAALQAKQNGTGDDTKLKEEIDGITETRIHMKSYSFSGPLLSSKLGMPLKVLRT